MRRIRQQQHGASADVPVRFEGLPGEYLQVDWGEVRRFPFQRQTPATRYFLVCRLKYSRWSWLRFTSTMRQETLFRGLIGCFVALGWVPWVLVFDNMKTVTTGRDAAGDAIWHPALLQLAAEFGFHPEACAVGAGNQKGSVESLVKWVKGNFLLGRAFADDADLTAQATDWVTAANGRPSSATRVAPDDRLAEEAAKGGRLPVTARDYGFADTGRVTRESLVHVHGNQYSVPLGHVGAPVTVRVHREQVALWRGLTLLASHRRAPDGAHQRIIVPEHFALLFGQKPRAQVMLYRQALLELGEPAAHYISELSHRRCEHLREEILPLYALLQQHGAARLLGAFAQAGRLGAYGHEYVTALLTPFPEPLPRATSLLLAGVPEQAAIDRPLAEYEAWVQGRRPGLPALAQPVVRS